MYEDTLPQDMKLLRNYLQSLELAYIYRENLPRYLKMLKLGAKNFLKDRPGLLSSVERLCRFYGDTL